MAQGIDHLIINSPYEEPRRHWAYDRESQRFERRDGRRPAGYVRATPGSDSFDDPGIFMELPLVNQVRPRVRSWREAGYPGVTGTTKRLLAHWSDPETFQDNRRFFFCQLEAAETLVWLTEGPPAERQGILIPSDGGAFPRLCAKMATGSGKTVVMALVIAWHVLNKVADPQDRRFSKNVLVIAPGLTVRNRLRVLEPAGEDNFYEKFDVVPSGLRDRLRQGRVIIRNWHALGWETAERLAKRRTVDKRGAKSDEAYVREVLGEMASAKNVLVINDEAHHAWRIPADTTGPDLSKPEQEEATVWVGGLAPEVEAWAKNDHLGFEVHYVFQGAVRKYRPDFLIRLRGGLHLILEVKGQATGQDQAKRAALMEWVHAVNEHGGFGPWACDVSFGPSDLRTLLAKHAASHSPITINSMAAV